MKSRRTISPSRACTPPSFLRLPGACSPTSRLTWPNRNWRTCLQWCLRWLLSKCSFSCNSSNQLFRCSNHPSRTTSCRAKAWTTTSCYSSSNNRPRLRYYSSNKNSKKLRSKLKPLKLKARLLLPSCRSRRKSKAKATSQTLLLCAKKTFLLASNSPKVSKGALIWTSKET